MTVLREVDFAICAGEFVAIVGPNGSGKTTLVKSILGLAERSAGGLDLFGVPAEQYRQRWRIGYVPQRHTVGGPIPATVREVVTSGRLPRSGLWRLPNAADRTAVSDAIDRVSIGDLSSHRVNQLSGGQQRRVLIARALAAEAEVLLLDEPTAGVDVESQTALVAVLGRLSQQGVTIAVVTHDLEPFSTHLTRVAWVSHGRIEYDGDPTQAILTAASEPFAHHDHDDDPPHGSLTSDLRTGG
ncbi:MAG: metal ABC transporter ATP-binding protein [Actinomycetia bacterium]|nr:metal ABC transporter ATP-binding protein [Actinomycetes bacterium]